MAGRPILYSNHPLFYFTTHLFVKSAILNIKGTFKKSLSYSGEDIFVYSRRQKRNLAGLNENFDKAEVAEKNKPETKLGFFRGALM